METADPRCPWKVSGLKGLGCRRWKLQICAFHGGWDADPGHRTLPFHRGWGVHIPFHGGWDGDLGRQRGRSPSLDSADVDHVDREEAGAAIL